MSDQPRTRQELYDRIRQIGREEFILEEMIRYGFWPAQGTIPEDPADEIRRRGELQRELGKLREESRILHNEEALRKRLLQERLAESRRKRQETKERREKERQQRADAWREKKAQEITYLGEGVSGGLNNTDGDEERLQSYGLPICGKTAQIATAMGITVGELRFLAFSRQTSTITHYIRFKIPKKTGGERLISAPMPRLKNAQHWILNNILEKLELHDTAHGFRHNRSIVSNAQPHVGSDVIINFDLKDFFPSISYKRVKGLFHSFGYSEAAATIFGLLCTEPEIAAVELDGKTYYVALTHRHLPQGSPASPAITNLLCRRLDRRLSEMAENLGFVYTRYADDLTFSASGDSLRHICNILRRTESIVTHEGFAINPEKTRILRKNRQQEVTGIVVNEKPTIAKKELKRFRATLYQIEKDGIAGKQWGNSDDVMASIQGYANFVAMVNPEKGAEFQEKVRRIKERYGANS
ncbi:MAG TPA: RNA-dependent DNA polymerase [Cyanobacteria bacterium UBA11149]|nr:RNA-dependent DNA polymerase [Cyanobacteria bacterium UBA11367]HBE56140.1 RNA-dependent DNA polymerase [Cyanobacteria bacterium UBA11366]HBK65210.1 RNA-dependent DNA polymerase [Cyanobacteria bacterium UBA11166]HBR76051.1 RNA-dependent DNA polymerase [Cyanobacteria bacterium UBA11159]HBS69241.1 RNA-dependent DNA polymerase [Cyanobacteria bacterium UBA11153]HBW88091.1 RNA-dependent DNA polymerase [Cyanobacteria bacterium UBA11149]HCA96191.1 RNA-dependent DNA polymerase [Cyanobacteria bacter